MNNKLVVIKEGQSQQEQQEEYQDPASVFMYALKAPETKRQWSRRLKVFLDFLQLEEPFEKQAKQFLIRTKQDHKSAQHNLLRFMTFQQERVKQGKISKLLFRTITRLSSYSVK
jgi:hypothetical protein